ncbi:hypothetical protein LXL04_023038 [Taraxacum kok-saghyz]
MASRSRGDGNYRNPCLTMHQPWASLLVYGIKRIEGRSWPSPVTGRLWIHAAGKVPEPETIKAMEDFYRQLYELDGVTDLKFPEHYPVSRLIGPVWLVVMLRNVIEFCCCVEVVGCVTSEELTSWEDIPQGARPEGLTPFCWLCEQPQKLIVPFEMRGYQGVYNLEKRILEGALRGLSPIEAQKPIKFPFPDPRNRFSLKPGSLTNRIKNGLKTSETHQDSSPNLKAAIAGARTAANQF